jgi:hypothetical protein
VPATLTEAREVLAQADPSTIAPLSNGHRYQELSSSYAGIPQRWLVVYAEARQARVTRRVAKQVCIQSESDLKAFK